MIWCIVYVVAVEQRVGNDDNTTRVLPNNAPSSCRERKVEVEWRGYHQKIQRASRKIGIQLPDET
jgi:hypothetical protein